MMKTYLITALLFGSLSIAARAGDPGSAQTKNAPREAVQTSARSSIEDKFRLALVEEETSQHLDSVIQAYKEVIAGFDDQRKMAVTAIFHLGECYRKQGKTNEAAAQYERILRDFSEQKQVGDLARGRLAEWNPARSGNELSLAAGLPAPKAFDPEQVKMLREEIKLVERQLQTVQKMYENGKASSEELFKPQQDLFTLQRQLPENSSPDKQKAILEQQLKINEKRLQEMRNKIQVGVAPPLDAIPIEREILGLKRELMLVSQPPAAAVNTPEDLSISREEADELQKLKGMLKDSPDLINAKDNEGKTPLHRAAALGHLESVKFLMANNANIAARDQYGRTALHLASENGRKSIVEFLLSQNADVNSKDDLGTTPLLFAAQKGFKSVAQVLIENHADVNVSGDPYKRGGNRFNSALHISLSGGYLDIAKLLLENKANPNATNFLGETPLLMLFWPRLKDINPPGDNSAEAVELLCQYKADVNFYLKRNQQTGWSGTPLHFAAMYSSKATEALISHGAAVNAINETGDTPLHKAVEWKNDKSAAFLLDHGAEINAANNIGETPLHIAIRKNQTAIVELLLGRKADVNKPNKAGQSPLTLTKTVEFLNPNNRAYTLKASPELEALLRRHGAVDLPASAFEESDIVVSPITSGAQSNTSDNADNRFFFISGEVRTPSRMSYNGKVTVLQAIQVAGGFTDFADKRNVKLTKAVDGTSVIVDCIKAKSDPTLDAQVNPGDKITVPRRQF